MIFTENIILNSRNLFYRLADKPITSSLCTKSNVLLYTQEQWNRRIIFILFFCLIETSPSFIDDLLFLFLPPPQSLFVGKPTRWKLNRISFLADWRTYESTLMRKEDILGFTDVHAMCNVFKEPTVNLHLKSLMKCSVVTVTDCVVCTLVS